MVETKSPKISAIEWKNIKALYGNKCAICGEPDTDGKTLVKAHLLAKTKNGTQVIPMCRNCHARYDAGLLTDKELKKLGMSREDYMKMLPKKSGPKPSSEKSSTGSLNFKDLVGGKGLF
jgi:hypothetical protein